MFSLDQVLNLLIAYRYAIIFPIAALEGPIISIICGFLISAGYFNFILVYLVLVLADLFGDTIYYSIGRFGGLFFIKKWGRFIGVDEVSVLKLEEKFKKHETKLLFFGKTQAFGSAILASAGIIKMPYLRFLWINTVATFIKSFILLIIGYYFGRAYEAIDNYIFKISLVSILVLLFIFVAHKVRQRKNQ